MKNLDSLILYITKLGYSSTFLSGAKYVIDEIKNNYNNYGLELIKSKEEMEKDYYNVLEDHNKWLQSIIKPILSISFTIKGDNFEKDDYINSNDNLIIDENTNEIKINQIDKIKNLEKEIINLKNQISKLRKDNDDLKNSNNKKNNIPTPLKKIYKSFEDFYDVVIDIKSIKDIKEGWKIKMNERGKNNYNSHKDENEIKIGIIGNSNKGKSFILSKLSKINLPSGMSIRTEGLSIKYPELKEYKNKKIILLDSDGLETPVIKDNKEDIIDNEKFREKSRDKLITELFLQNYIIQNSDILILVIGILTYSGQKLLNRIKTKIQRLKINNFILFII